MLPIRRQRWEKGEIVADVELIPPGPRPEDERKDGATRAAMDVALAEARERFEARTGEQLLLIPDEALPDDDEPGDASAGRRGRPPGARNKVTADFLAFIRATTGDPLIGLAKAASMDTLTLAKALGAKPFDVWTKQADLLKALLPYFHAARPAELRVSGGGALAVAVFTGEGPRGDQEIEAKDAATALLRLALDQGVSEVEGDLSNDPSSNDRGVSSVVSRG
jgi:hypothetical protein